jgi:alcohol dehydrogenase, propanol-preferring
VRALVYRGPRDVALTEIPEPELRPGTALVRVAAAGVCRTDVELRASRTPAVPLGTVLGHEIAGTVAAVDDSGGDSGGAHGGPRVGDAVVVHPVWSCRSCRQCVAGRTNACLSTAGRGVAPPVAGVSVHGGLAELVAVPVSALVPAPALEPALAATLTDAGLVPYHSINAARDLLRPGSTAVVIGVGGLGQFAVALLRATTAARVVVVDVRPEALATVADDVDAAVLATSPDATRQVLTSAGGHGADLVLDLVGSTATLAMASAVVAPYGAIRVPGQSGGALRFETDRSSSSLPRGATICRPYSGTFQDLVDLVALAGTGLVRPVIHRYPLDRATEAIDDLEHDRITGRAVVTMS